MPNSRAKRARTSVDTEEPSPIKSKQRHQQQSRSPSPSNGTEHGSPRRSVSPHHNIPNDSEDEDGSSIDIVGLDPSSSSSASLSGNVQPKKPAPSKNSKNSRSQACLNGVKLAPKAEPVLYCLVQHPIASTSPIPSTPASTCYKCNKKLVVPRPGAMSRLFGFVCPDCGRANPHSRSWIDSVVTALLNLELNYGGHYFHHKEGICSFIDRNWDLVCGTRDRTATWWKTVLATITTRTEVFRSEQFGSGRWALVQRLLEERKLTSPQPPSPTQKKKPAPAKASPALHKTELRSNHTTPRKATPNKSTAADKANGTPRKVSTTPSAPPSSAPVTPAPAQAANGSGAASATPVVSAAAVISNTEPWDHPVLHDRTCHQCKVVKPVVISCDAFVPATAKLCLFKFCAICLDKYNDDMEKIARAPSTWMCPSCRELCICAQCKRARVMGTPPSVRLPRLKVPGAAGSASATPHSQPRKRSKSSLYDSDEDPLEDEFLELGDDDEEDPQLDDDFDDFDEFEDDFDVFPGDDADLNGGGASRKSKTPPANSKDKKKKKRPPQKKSINDWDIGRIVYNGRPEACAITRLPTYEIHLPKFRVLNEPASPKKAPPSPSPKKLALPSTSKKVASPPPTKAPARGGKGRKAESDKDGAADGSDSSGSEDVSDSAYTKRHERAATIMRAQLFPGVDPSRTRV